jgi:hypothetical protein
MNPDAKLSRVWRSVSKLTRLPWVNLRYRGFSVPGARLWIYFFLAVAAQAHGQSGRVEFASDTFYGMEEEGFALVAA